MTTDYFIIYIVWSAPHLQCSKKEEITYCQPPFRSLGFWAGDVLSSGEPKYIKMLPDHLLHQLLWVHSMTLYWSWFISPRPPAAPAAWLGGGPTQWWFHLTYELVFHGDTGLKNNNKRNKKQALCEQAFLHLLVKMLILFSSFCWKWKWKLNLVVIQNS